MSTLKSILGSRPLVTFSMHSISEAADLLSCLIKDINVCASNGLVKLCVKVPEDVVTLLTVKRKVSFLCNDELYEPMLDIDYLELSNVQCNTFALNEYIAARQFEERGFEYNGTDLIRSRKVSKFELNQGYPIIPTDYYYYIFIDKSAEVESYDSLNAQIFNNDRTFFFQDLYISSDQLAKLEKLLVSQWADEQRELGCLSSPIIPIKDNSEQYVEEAFSKKNIDRLLFNKNFPPSFKPHANIPKPLHNLANLTNELEKIMQEKEVDGETIRALCEEYFKGYSKTNLNVLKAMVSPLHIRKPYSEEDRMLRNHWSPEVLAAFDMSQQFWAKADSDDQATYPRSKTIIDALKAIHPSISNSKAELIVEIVRYAKRRAGRKKQSTKLS